MDTPFSDWATPFQNRCLILGELWAGSKDEESFASFLQYNDIGLPLAWSVWQRLAEPTEEGKHYINETWEMFATSCMLDTDTEYVDLDSVDAFLLARDSQ